MFHGTESGLLVILLILLLKEKMKLFKNIISSIIQSVSIFPRIIRLFFMYIHSNYTYKLWSNVAWIAPFITFIVGYFFLQLFISDNVVQVPALLGQDLLQATKICSQYTLNLRIIDEKEVVDVQPGTIVKQKPLPGKSIKRNQSIFIVITKLPEPVLAPHFITEQGDQIEKTCQDKGIKNKFYFIESSYPQGQCFGQIPLCGQPLEHKKMSSYISAGTAQQYLFPDLTYVPLQDVMEFFKQYNILCDVYYKDQKIIAPYSSNFIVVNQKPLSGTLVQPNNKLYVQLKVVI